MYGLQRFSRPVLLLALLGLSGCPSPPDDALEPNNSTDQATPLNTEASLQALAVQGNPDVFAVTIDEPAESNQPRFLEFTFTTFSGEVCPAFTAISPGGTILYQDTNHFCSRDFSTPLGVPPASLMETDDSFTLRVPAPDAGTYFVAIEEKGQADNVFDYVWSYQVTAHISN